VRSWVIFLVLGVFPKCGGWENTWTIPAYRIVNPTRNNKKTEGNDFEKTVEYEIGAKTR
jgi:hypothetical protein